MTRNLSHYSGILKDASALISRKWLHLIFIIFCILIGSLQIGNYQGRLATIHGDDSPIVYSHYFAYPGRYENDILSTYGTAQILATIQNWLPALSYRFFGISPDFFSLLLIYLQFILLGFSARIFAKTVTGSEIVGWITAFVIFGASPWDWNLANYGNIMYTPYAGHIVIPFILFSISELLLAKFQKSMLWLFFASLIHPILTLFAAVFIALFLIFQRTSSLSKWLYLSIIFLFSVLPRVIIVAISNVNDGLLTFSDMEAALLANGHMAPIEIRDREYAFLMFVPLMLLAFGNTKGLCSRYLTLWLAAFVCSLILVGFSWIGWQYKILSIIQFIPQRSTSLLVFLSLPLVVSYLYQRIQAGLVFEKILSSGFLFLLIRENLAFLNSTAYPIYLIVLLIDDLVLRKQEIFRNIDQLLKNKTKAIFSAGLVLEGKKPEFFIPITITILASGVLFNSWQFGAPASSRESLDGYEIQLWTRNNTPEDAMIINMNRTVSQRASLSTDPYNWYVYNRSRACKEAVDNIHNTYLNAVSSQQSDESAITSFSEKFGADYILRYSSEPLKLPEAHRNNSYILYQIPAK